jgi:glutamate:GABA antiporter
MAIIERVPEATSVPNTELPSEEYVPKAMPRMLGTWDMTTTFIVSIYLASGATTAALGGPSAITYLILGALTFFVPCLIATAQLGILFPHEGSLYNWTHKAIGGRASFFVGFCAWFPGVLISASIGDLFVTYLQGFNSQWLVQPWQQGVVIMALLILAGILSIQRFRMLQHVLNGLCCLLLLSSVFIGLACVLWLLTGHHSATDFSHLSDWNVNPGNIFLFGLIVFAYIGTESPLNMAAELKEKQEHLIVKRHLLWGGLIIFGVYMLNTIAVLVVLGQKGTVPFALVTMVDMMLGKVVGNITAVCLMASILATTLVYNYIYARILFVGAIDGFLPARMGQLNKHRVPANAIIFQTILAVVCTAITFIFAPQIAVFGNPADLAAEVYFVTQAAAILVWAISAAFLFINLVGCYRRHRQAFLQKLILPLPVLWLCVGVGTLSCAFAIIDTLLYSWVPLIGNNQWWIIVGFITFIFLAIAGVGSVLASSEATWQSISGGGGR